MTWLPPSVRGSPSTRRNRRNRISAWALLQPDHHAVRRAGRASDPVPDRLLAVEPARPGIAIAVARAGLAGDAPAKGVGRRRRPAQHIADIPGGHRLQETLEGRRRGAE